jgi:hypothetical protein
LLLLKLPWASHFLHSFKRYLLEASDVVLGTLEPATIKNEKPHTHLLSVPEAMRSLGVPSYFPVQKGKSRFRAIERDGRD